MYYMNCSDTERTKNYLLDNVTELLFWKLNYCPNNS